MCISFVSIGYETMTVIRARVHVQSHESALLTDIFVAMELLIIVCSLTEFRQTMFPINV